MFGICVNTVTFRFSLSQPRNQKFVSNSPACKGIIIICSYIYTVSCVVMFLLKYLPPLLSAGHHRQLPGTCGISCFKQCFWTRSPAAELEQKQIVRSFSNWRRNTTENFVMQKMKLFSQCFKWWFKRQLNIFLFHISETFNIDCCYRDYRCDMIQVCHNLNRGDFLLRETTGSC